MNDLARRSIDVLSESLVKSLSSLAKDGRLNFLSLLIAFWHAVLNLAVEAEDATLQLAASYSAQHRLKTSPWKSAEFSQFLKDMHDRKFTRSLNSLDEVPKASVFVLMPFLITMRFEPWFNVEMENVNCSLQLLIRFEALYIDPSRRRYASEKLLPDNHAMQLLLRHIWHVLLFSNAGVFNNAFAFCLCSLSQKYKIMWHDYYVANIFAVAGSILASTQLYSVAATIFAHNNGEFEETVWLMLSLTHEKTREQRVLQCTLTQRHLSGNLYFKPLLPLLILPPYPMLEKQFTEVVLNEKLLAEEVVSNNVDALVVKTAILWARAEKTTPKNSAYRVEQLSEIVQISRRMADLFVCMIDGANVIQRLQLELKKHVALAKNSKRSKREQEQFIAEQKERINGDCKLILHIRENSVAMFSLLKAICDFGLN